MEKYNEPIFPAMNPYKEAAKQGESGLGPTKMRSMNMKRDAMHKAYLDRWQATGKDGKDGKKPIDGIIMPATPWAASRLGFTQKAMYVGYTGVFNLVGMYCDLWP